MTKMKDCPMCKQMVEFAEETGLSPPSECPMCDMGAIMTSMARGKVPREMIIRMMADAVNQWLPVIGQDPLAKAVKKAGLVGPDGKALH